MKKHIVCFGDSNTHGYCADPMDTESRSDRFTENERWTHLLAKQLGEDYLILEEGLSGRTTVFPDALHESMPGLDVIYATLMSHEPVDLLVIMLGTNDTKERMGASAACIGIGMQRLVEKAKTVPCWRDGKPNILVICPPHILPEMLENTCAAAMGGMSCIEKSRALAPYFAQTAAATGAHFLDAQGIGEFNRVDGMHLTAAGHASLANTLAKRIPELL